MSMGFSFSLSPHLSHEQRQELKLTQRLEVRQSLDALAIRVEILQALRPGEHACPEGSCPKCLRDLTIKEILEGFLDDVNDTTTSCPECKHRFQPRLVARSVAGYTSIAFLCEKQTLGRLPELASLSFEEIQRNHQQVLASARFYWGTITKGFSLIGRTFVGEPSLTWKDKVKPFLGKCPDTLIAELCDVSPSTVHRYRVSLGVAAFQRSQMTAVN